MYLASLLSDIASPWLVSWQLSALSLAIVANVIPGIQVSGFAAALIAALVFGFVNGVAVDGRCSIRSRG